VQGPHLLGVSIYCYQEAFIEPRVGSNIIPYQGDNQMIMVTVQ
jgi:hypothetical protein